MVDRAALLQELSAAVHDCLSADQLGESFEVDGLRPRAVCEPRTPEEAAAALAVAGRQGAAVIPWGGGTRMAVGFPPRSADIVLRTTSLDHIVEYEPADLTVTVEAGMRLAALQVLLGGHDQMLALDPPAADRATIGGVVASGASGPMRLLYGTARDLVIGTRVANAEGMLTKAGGRVVKNVAGYDLNKLYAGSFGTAGVIVELSFKLHPLPPSRGTLVAVFRSPAEGQAVVQALVKSPLGPAALDLIDAQIADDVLDINVPDQGVALAAMAVGFESAVTRQLRDMAALCEGALECTVLDRAVGEAMWDGIRAFADLTSLGDRALLKVSVPPALSAAAMERVRSAGGEADLGVAAVARAGTGVVYARVDARDDWDGRALAGLGGVVEQVREYARSVRGSLVVESCPSPLKSTVDVWGDVGATFRLVAAIKERFDPHGVLNPGRFVGRL